MNTDGAAGADAGGSASRVRLFPLVVDQALYSASNVIVAVVAGIALDRHGFGIFATQLLVVTAIVSLVRSTWYEARLAHPRSAWIPLPRSVPLVAAAALASVGLCHPSGVLVLVAAGSTALVQDHLRYRALHQRRLAALILGDGAWALLTCGLLAGIVTIDSPDAALLWWAICGAASLPLLLLGRAVDGQPDGGVTTDVAGPWVLFAEHLLNHGPVQLSMLASAAFLRPEGFALLRSAVTVMGPAGVLTLALATWCFATNTGGDGHGVDPWPAISRSLLVAGAGSSVLALLLVLPVQIGHRLLGASWPTRPVLAAVGVMVLAQAVSTTGLTLLKLRGASRRLLQLRLAAGAALVTSVSLAGLTGSTSAVAVAFAASSVALAVGTALSVRSELQLRRSPAVPHRFGWPFAATPRAAGDASARR